MIQEILFMVAYFRLEVSKHLRSITDPHIDGERYRQQWNRLYLMMHMNRVI